MEISEKLHLPQSEKTGEEAKIDIPSTKDDKNDPVSVLQHVNEDESSGGVRGNDPSVVLLKKIYKQRERNCRKKEEN